MAAADKTPQVSVIIPAYNRADTLAMAVQSVLAQTFHDFEFIIIDDGSADDLAGALTSFDDPRLRLLTHERRRGAAAARNTGFAAARGDYVAFLDADDEWLPTQLAKQLAVMATAPPKVHASTTAFFLHRPRGPQPELRVTSFYPVRAGRHRRLGRTRVRPGLIKWKGQRLAAARKLHRSG